MNTGSETSTGTDAMTSTGTGSDRLIDAEALIAARSVEELAARADELVRSMEDPSALLAKPCSSSARSARSAHLFRSAAEWLAPLPGMTVLDFGAGSCWTSHFLTQLGCRVIAMDISEAMLDLGSPALQGTACFRRAARARVQRLRRAPDGPCGCECRPGALLRRAAPRRQHRATSCRRWGGSCGLEGSPASRSRARTTRKMRSPSTRCAGTEYQSEISSSRTSGVGRPRPVSRTCRLPCSRRRRNGCPITTFNDFLAPSGRGAGQTGGASEQRPEHKALRDSATSKPCDARAPPEGEPPCRSCVAPTPTGVHASLSSCTARNPRGRRWPRWRTFVGS